MRPIHSVVCTAIGRLCIALILVSTGVSTGALAQVPDEFTNLKFFPKDISKGELLDAMKGFTRALSVRCEHCHVGEPGKPLSTFDFPSDEKNTKQVARIMLQMAHDTNARLAKDLGRASSEVVAVSCATCHRGLTKPRFIIDVMAEEEAGKGIESALAAYHQLREESYGSGTYDFSESPLQRWATKLAHGGRTDDALAVLAMTEQLFPDSIRVKALVGEVYLIAGDKERAISQFRKVLALDPTNRIAMARLGQLEGAPTDE